MSETCHFISLAVAAVDIPDDDDATSPAPSHLTAIAMLIAERDEQDRWRFTLERQAIPAGDADFFMREKDATLHFDADADGRVNTLTFVDGRPRPGRRIEPVSR